jgi:peroxin-6
LDSLLAAKQLAPDVSIIDLARRTAAFVAGDLSSLVIRASYAAITRVTQAMYVHNPLGISMIDPARSGDDFTSNDIFSAGVSLTNADFEIAMDEARSSYSQNIGAPKIPNVSWDDVGGLADVKADILDTVQLPLEHPELFASNLKKRSGSRKKIPIPYYILTRTLVRYSALRSSGYRQDAARQSGRDVVLA